MKLAPIVLFVYNRPQHTRQTLESLSKNDLSDQSILYIYADGARGNASSIELEKIHEVRRIIREKKWCKEVYFIESDKNKGLAASIIEGVTEIVNEQGRIIVLEDDLLLSRGFLKYMNEALERYQEFSQVMQVSGHSFLGERISKSNSAFFMAMSDSWGWATWKRAWNLFDERASGYEILKSNQDLEEKFNLDGVYPYSQMLFKQMETNEIESWAIRWWWSVFKNNGLALFPDRSLVKNFGFGTYGTHTKGDDPFAFQEYATDDYYINNFPEQVRQSEVCFKEVKKYLYDVGHTKEKSYSGSAFFTFVKRVVKQLKSSIK